MLKTRTLKRVIFALCAIAVVGVASRVLAEAGETAAQKEATKVSLQIATVLNASKTTLAFTVTNNSAEEVKTTPIATNANRVVIMKPNGQVIEHYSQKRFISPIVIGVSKSKTWKVDISRIFDYWKLDSPGIYRVYWKMENYESSKILLLKE